MDRTQIADMLQTIFRDVLDPGLTLTDDLDASQVESWDSLNHITLIVEIERQFGVELTTSELAELRNVGDMLTLLQQKKVKA